jgi:hypothetical protein
VEATKPKVKRKRRRRKSVGRYFRELFTSHPRWLDLKTNELVQAQYEKDHPGKKMTKSVRANMANIKSVMRKEQREGGRKKGAGVANADWGLNTPEGLEIAIDQCLSAARALDPAGLDPVIRALRRARYELALQMGEP